MYHIFRLYIISHDGKQTHLLSDQYFRLYGCSSSSYLLMCHYQEDLVPWSNSDHPGLLDEGINILCSPGKEYTACTIK